MNLAEQAFFGLYPEGEDHRIMTVKYSRALKNYRANVRYTSQTISFKLGYALKDVSDDIKIGLIQSLFLKLFKDKKTTMQIELYHAFLQQLSTYAAVSQSDPELRASFSRVNERYFNGMMDIPNLIWGKGTTKLGHFEYASNTILISDILQGNELLDYVMYHEMLHKKLKFHMAGSKTMHHTPEFRRLERLYHDPDAERKLQEFVRRKKRRFWF